MSNKLSGFFNGIDFTFEGDVLKEEEEYFSEDECSEEISEDEYEESIDEETEESDFEEFDTDEWGESSEEESIEDESLKDKSIILKIWEFIVEWSPIPVAILILIASPFIFVILGNIFWRTVLSLFIMMID